MPRSKASIRRPDCSVGASAKEAAAFNAHSPGGTGCGLVQHVFHLPARIQLRSPTAGSQCAAPPSEKRCTLSRVKPDTSGSGAAQLLARLQDASRRDTAKFLSALKISGQLVPVRAARAAHNAPVKLS